MLPSILAGRLKQGLVDYMRTTFPMTNEPFRDSFDDFVDGSALCQSPFVSAKLPFRHAPADAPWLFRSIERRYAPYGHQQRAFERLTGAAPRSTIVATGTGSGKTECFLYPVLEDCYRRRVERNEPGIKAIVVYPMNALASDQARRFAEAVDQSPKLRGKITVGMYVGGTSYDAPRVMSEKEVITNRQEMLSNPPDVLLTNYKMLDYLLVRPSDAKLWDRNDAETLRYLVVDELHTFDGAQGTDLACLVRRLKARLGVPKGSLCCVGTSATIGADNQSERILDYARNVFGEPFDSDAVVVEDRLAPDEFLAEFDPYFRNIPSADQLDHLANLALGEDVDGYLRAAIEAWVPDVFNLPGADRDPESPATRVQLADALKCSRFFHQLVRALGGRYRRFPELAEELAESFPKLAALDKPRRETLLASIFALVSHARVADGCDPDDPGAEIAPQALRPFLNVQVQFWLKELRRLVATVPANDVDEKQRPLKPRFALARDLAADDMKKRLPVLNCRDCGHTAWGTLSLKGDITSAALKDLEIFYNKYFGSDESICFLYPGLTSGRDDDNSFSNDKREDRFSFAESSHDANLCPDSLAVDFGKPGGVDEITARPALRVTVVKPKPASLRKGSHYVKKGFVCPCCGSEHGLSIIGLRSASQISVSLAQMLSSRFNGDRKALAFSDNVQDAAHRAAFFSARSWRFSFRSAVQEFVRINPQPRTLDVFVDDFMKYWTDKSLEDFVGLLIPHDMLWMRDYENSVEKGRLVPAARKYLVADLAKRLRMELYLEFGATSHVGRTLEKSGCSVLAFDPVDVDAIARNVRDYAVNSCGFKSVKDSGNRFAGFKELRVFQRLVFRFLEITRRNGAFADEIYRAFLNADCADYLITPDRKNNRRLWAPSLGTHRRNIPHFLVDYSYDESAEKLPRDAAAMARYPYSAEYLEAARNVLAEYIGSAIYADPRPILKRIFDAAVERNLLVLAGESSASRGKKALKYYGLNLSKVLVSHDVVQMRCQKCGEMRAVAWHDVDFAEEAPCVNRKCGGFCKLNPERCNDRHDAFEPDGAALDYYGRLYRGGETTRIVAREHTGLLEREARERLENDFKLPENADPDTPPELRRRAWTPNVLSCTPTLEMGVDIGDLSSVVMCGMPPGQSQFLQRCGRAGRKDGNALVAVAAAAKPRDLYYYADPREMLDGAVDPPSVLLSAAAVLERQFVAFCMDNWVAGGLPENAIPKTVKYVLDEITPPKPAKKGVPAAPVVELKPTFRESPLFPFNFFRYVRENRNALRDGFLAIFDGALSRETIDAVDAFIYGRDAVRDPDNPDAPPTPGDGAESPVLRRVYDVFEALGRERDGFVATVKDLKEKVDELKAKPASDESWNEEIANLEAEIKGFNAVLSEIRMKNVFNFLSDEGVLPNYAFPEAGVVLRAIIKRRSETPDGPGADVAAAAAIGAAIAESTGMVPGAPTAGVPQKPRRGVRYDQTKLEFMRAAASAITEFAPNNAFYADGRKFTVDQIDVKTSEPAWWRLCPECSHAELDAEAQGSVCPRCRCKAWSDVGQRRRMLRVQTVYSNVDYRDSLLDDSAEERSSAAYCKQLLVEFNPTSVEKAYQTKTERFEFGYEFVSKATLREINFGEKDFVGDKLTVAGDQQVRKGFRVCLQCGKIQSPAFDALRDGGRHTYSCPARKNPMKNQDYAECLFLYREFETEILRVLIPATAEAPDLAVRDSFAAAFMLGLNRKFGAVSHLRCAFSDVKLPDSEIRRQALVLYDSVPGGTGYLKQLMQDPDEVFDVFQKAYDALKACSCKDDIDRDGCYRCLFAHSVGGQNVGCLSRHTALELLDNLLKARGAVEQTRSIDEMQIELIVDSELEKMFVSAVKERARGTWRDSKYNKSYTFKLGDSAWEIVLQPDFSGSFKSRSEVMSKPDFVLIPRDNNTKNTSGNLRRPVVVFTDGFEYHRNIPDADVLKREELRRHGFIVWSLSYNDVKAAFNPENVDEPVELFDPVSYPNTNAFNKKIQKVIREVNKKAGQNAAQNAKRDVRWEEDVKPKLTAGAFSFLIDFLTRPDGEELYAGVAQAYALAALPGRGAETRNLWETRWRGLRGGNFFHDVPEEDSVPHVGQWAPKDEKGGFLSLGVGLWGTKADTLAAFAILNDSDRADERYKPGWNAFWNVVNLMQLLPNFAFASLSAFANGNSQFLADPKPDDAFIACGIGEYAPGTDDGMNEEWERFCKENDINPYDYPIGCACVKRFRGIGAPIPSACGVELGAACEVFVDFLWEEERVAVLHPSPDPDDDSKPEEFVSEERIRAVEALGFRVFVVLNADDAAKLPEDMMGSV